MFGLVNDFSFSFFVILYLFLLLFLYTHLSVQCVLLVSAFAVKLFTKLVVHLFSFRELWKKSLCKYVSKFSIIILYNCLIALLSWWLTWKLCCLLFSIVILMSLICIINSWIHSRYVKSRSDQQLLHGLKSSNTGSCEPEESNNGLPVVPCGLIAWSLFNDTYTLIRGEKKLSINKKNISWESDRGSKFGKQVYPHNFQNGTLIGGGKLDPNIPVCIDSLLLVISLLFP